MPLHFTSLFQRRNTSQFIEITESAQRRRHATRGVFASDGVVAWYCGFAHAQPMQYRRVPFVVQSPFSRFQCSIVLTTLQTGS